jgi:hypothetical protein
MIVQKLDNILVDLCKIKEDAIKAEAGNKAASTRLRKAAMAAIKALKELRSASLERSKNL